MTLRPNKSSTPCTNTPPTRLHALTAVTTGLARGAAGNDVPLPKADAESPSLPSPTSRRSSTLRKHSSKREKRGLSHSNSHGDHAASDPAARSSSESCGSGSESDNGNYDVDRAIRLARKRASMRLRAENSRLALRASTHSLMAKLAGGVDLDGNDQITPQMMREQVGLRRVGLGVPVP